MGYFHTTAVEPGDFLFVQAWRGTGKLEALWFGATARSLGEPMEPHRL